MHIEKEIARTDIGPSAGLIPKIIHQTFETTDIPVRMHEAAMSWVRHNPDFTYRFYDNADRRAFITSHFGPDVVAAYDLIENGAFRADLWRYCQLYVDGGIYADIDSVCQAAMSDLIRSDDTFIVARAGNLDHALSNGFICVQAGHPFLKQAIERATRLIALKEYPFDGFMLTGPGNLGKAVNLCLGQSEETPHGYGERNEAGFAFRILEKRRGGGEQASHVTDGDRILLLYNYTGYRDDLKAQGLKHWQDGQRKAGLLTRTKRRVKRMLRRVT